MDEDFQHPPKQLEVIELKLDNEREKERKTKQKHEARIMGLPTSKYTSRLRAKGLCPHDSMMISSRKGTKGAQRKS